VATTYASVVEKNDTKDGTGYVFVFKTPMTISVQGWGPAKKRQLMVLALGTSGPGKGHGGTWSALQVRIRIQECIWDLNLGEFTNHDRARKSKNSNLCMILPTTSLVHDVEALIRASIGFPFPMRIMNTLDKECCEMLVMQQTRLVIADTEVYGSLRALFQGDTALNLQAVLDSLPRQWEDHSALQMIAKFKQSSNTCPIAVRVPVELGPAGISDRSLSPSPSSPMSESSWSDADLDCMCSLCGRNVVRTPICSSCTQSNDLTRFDRLVVGTIMKAVVKILRPWLEQTVDHASPDIDEETTRTHDKFESRKPRFQWIDDDKLAKSRSDAWERQFLNETEIREKEYLEFRKRTGKTNEPKK